MRERRNEGGAADPDPEESAKLEGPITVGKALRPVDPRGVDLDSIGYLEEEWFASGTARSFRAAGAVRANGRWDVEPDGAAPYRTRLLVRRPTGSGRRSGVVVVEWLNVSSTEVAPEWAYLEDALVQAGVAWVGVSAQSLGVVGGSALLGTVDADKRTGGGIRARGPERYGSLHHPGDHFAFDIYNQVSAALRGSTGRAVVGGEISAVIACGQSQSAAFLTTFVNAIQPRARTFDGFFVHSRGSGAAGLDGTVAMRQRTPGFHIRNDTEVPTMVFETETDVGPGLGYAAARQGDNASLRVWEVAGTSHADAYLVGRDFRLCSHRINDGPHHFVAKAGFTALVHWVLNGVPPVSSEPIRIDADGKTIVRDADGIAVGGIRTPSVEVPIAALSGDAPAGSDRMCRLFGSSLPFDPGVLVARYGTQRGYLRRFSTALDEAIKAGWVRPADRTAYFAETHAVDFPRECKVDRAEEQAPYRGRPSPR